MQLGSIFLAGWAMRRSPLLRLLSPQNASLITAGWHKNNKYSPWQRTYVNMVKHFMALKHTVTKEKHCCRPSQRWSQTGTWKNYQLASKTLSKWSAVHEELGVITAPPATPGGWWPLTESGVAKWPWCDIFISVTSCFEFKWDQTDKKKNYQKINKGLGLVQEEEDKSCTE